MTHHGQNRDQAQRRQHFRVLVAKDDELRIRIWQLGQRLEVIPDPPRDAHNATALNISAGGLLLSLAAVPFPFKITDIVGLALERGQDLNRLQAQIRYIAKAPPKPAKMGMQFLFDAASATDRRSQRQVERMIAEMQRDQLKRLSNYRMGT